jgi:hypothetical protein
MQENQALYPFVSPLDAFFPRMIRSVEVDRRDFGYGFEAKMVSGPSASLATPGSDEGPHSGFCAADETNPPSHAPSRSAKTNPLYRGISKDFLHRDRRGLFDGPNHLPTVGFHN